MYTSKLFYVALAIFLGVCYNLWRVLTQTFQITDMILVVGLGCVFFLYLKAVTVLFKRDSYIAPSHYEPEDTTIIRM